MKKKEADEMKGKNLGAIGITKFKSRSFEAFQKSGGKNLFPVDPSTPLEERPYMQRPGGNELGCFNPCFLTLQFPVTFRKFYVSPSCYR